MKISGTASVIPVLLLITFALSTRHSCFAEQSLRRDEDDREKSALTSPGRDMPVPRTPNSIGNSSVDGYQPKTTLDAQTKPVYGEENAPSVVPPVSAVTGDTGVGSMALSGDHKPDISSAAASDIAFTDIPQAGNNVINTTDNTHNTTVSNATDTSSSLDTTTTTTTTSTATTSTTTTTTTNTTTTTSNTISTTSTGTTTAGNHQCPEKCRCPDYDDLSQQLVPILRGLLGSAGVNYTDNVLKHVLHQQFLSNAEPIRSILSRINIALSQDLRHGKLIVLLEAARFGVTICWLNSNDTFFLDAAVEARLFPQVRFKQAYEKAQAADKARANSDGSTRVSSAEVPLDGGAEETYEGSRLYNISFFCDKGGKVVITRETSLYRYGRWRHANCEVATEGVLTTNGALPLTELSVIGGDAAWLRNITTSMHEDDLRNSWNSSSGGDAATGSGWNSSSGDVNMERGTVFPNVRDVTFSNTSLGVQELSDILSWFRNATDLILRNNSLGDFNCSQLLPSPAAWHDLLITRNGLKSVPACTLRASLVYLRLYKNDISDISPLQYPRLVPAPGLELLDLSDNNISDVGILADMNLTMLVLSGNRISSLHKLSFNRLPELGVLELSRNRLFVLDPGSFKSLVYLQELRLDHNHLQRFDSSVSPMRAPVNLRCKIFLGSNRFSHPPFRADGYDPGSYIVVYAADNPYACDCDMVGFVNATAGSYSGVNSSSSYADRASFRCRYPASLAGYPVERVASADDRCPVVADCPGGCTCTLSRSDSVVTVDCSGVEHFHQPSVLPATHPLRLEFQGNGTAQAQAEAMSLQDRAYLLRVVSLNVSGRGLTRVPEFMCEASPRAALLDLSFNNLTRLPRCLQTRPARENRPTLELRLAHNPWSCDCDAVDMRSWLAEMMGGTGVKGGVRVPDASEAWCSPDTRPGARVAEWDTSECEEPDYLPWVVTLGVILGLALVLGPLLYVHRLKAAVAIHAQFHVRPFERAPRFKEEDHDYEALVVHGPSDVGLAWVAGSLIPRTRVTRHRLCVPDRDFVPGASAAESYATAVTRSKATVCLLSLDSVHDDWWLYAFQLARAKNARCPRAKLLLVLLEHVEEADLPEEVRAFLKTNTYLSVDDRWFWKKLFYYLPDPPKNAV